MAPLLPSLFMRVGGLVGAPPAHSRDRTPVAMAWKDETACTKRLVVLLDDLATVEWDVSNVASGHQPEAPLEYCPGPADVPYVAVTGCVDLVLGLVVVLLTPAPNLNSPSGKRPPNTSGAQVLMYDVLAKKRHTRGLSLRDCPHSVAPLESVPQDISINCSGDILLTCLEDEIRLFSISAKPSAGHSQGGWFASAAKPHRQLWPMQSFSSAFIGARFCTVFPNRILGVSQPEEGARSAGIRAVRLEVQEEEGSSGSAAAPILATHNAPLGELPGRVTAWCWDAQGEALVVGTGDGLMALHQCSRADATKKSVAPGGRVVEALAWHPLGAVVLAALEGGVVAMLDAALQPLLVMADLPGCSISGASPSYEVDIAGVLARGGASAVHRRGVAPLLDWARPVTELTADGHRSPLYELVGLAIPCSGPQGFAVGVAQVAVGGVSGGRLRVQELTAQHLSDGEPLRALNLVELAVDRQAQYHGMQLLLDHMLRGGFGGADTSAIMGLIDETLSTLWPQTASFTAAQQAQLQQVVRRYTAKLLDMGWGEVAFKVATSCGCTKAMEDIYVAAAQARDAVLAQAVWDAIQALSDEADAKCLASVAQLQAMEAIQVEVAESSIEPSPRVTISSPTGYRAQAEAALLEVEGKVSEALAIYAEEGLHDEAGAVQALADAAKRTEAANPTAAAAAEYPAYPN